MFGFETISPAVEAMTTVGLVLVEAIALYVGYGAVARVTGPAARELLGGTE